MVNVVLAFALALQTANARVVVTVVDATGGVIPAATITIESEESSGGGAKATAIATNEKGIGTADRLVPGRYSIRAEFQGFETARLQHVQLRAGDNRRTIVLQLSKLRTDVTVAEDAQLAAANPHGNAFKTEITRQEIETLSDDPDEMAQELRDMAGANAVIKVDNFVAAALPPKAQIKSIHIVRDAFAAENHSAESDEIQIITQPGVGALRGGGSTRLRDGSMSARSPFTPVKGPERTQNYEANLGGTLVKDKASFSVSFGHRNGFDTPNLNVKLPTGSRAEALNLRRLNDHWSFRGLVDYALTLNQVLRLSYQQSTSDRSNLGVGGYDLIERSYGSDSHDYEIHVQEAGPIGRRFFANTRLQVTWSDSASHAALEAATIRVLDAFTSGGAQVAGGRRTREFELASDLDYIRGVHSVRSGILLEAGSFRSTDSANYLGTYTFASEDDFIAGSPMLYTRRIGDPLVEYWNVRSGVYLQDDIRVRKGLTISPGIRYEVQTHLHDGGSFAPRFGISWAPKKEGDTTLRGSWGLFHGWLNTGTYEQTLRVDGFRQRELNVVNPAYPDPGSVGTVTVTNRYMLGDDPAMPRTMRFSAGIERILAPGIRVNASYSHAQSRGLFAGVNLNAPVNGFRPDPRFANVISVVSDARSRSDQLATTLTLNLAGAARPGQERWNPRRTTIRLSHWMSRIRNDSDGPFSVSPGGTRATEWAIAAQDRPNRIAASINSQALRKLNATLSFSGTSGSPYTMTTGRDDNGDSIFNDRPIGVGRNTLRTPWQWFWSTHTSYALPIEKYRVSFNVVVTNLTNHPNYVGFSGVMTSPFFMTARDVMNPRKVDFGMSVRF